MPLHHIKLELDLVSGNVASGLVAACSVFQIKGVTVGNDLAGGKILVKPEITAIPIVSEDLEKKYPNVFSVCAITRATARKKATFLDGKCGVDLVDTFMADSLVSHRNRC